MPFGCIDTIQTMALIMQSLKVILNQSRKQLTPIKPLDNLS